jgi:hypothetical protein
MMTPFEPMDVGLCWLRLPAHLHHKQLTLIDCTTQMGNAGLLIIY